MRKLLALVVPGLSLALGALPLAMAPAAAQTGHDKACLVVANETNGTIHVSAMPPKGAMGLGVRLNVGARKKDVAMVMGSPLRSPDWSRVQVEPASASLSWVWDGDFRRVEGFAPNEQCDGAWILTVR